MSKNQISCLLVLFCLLQQNNSKAQITKTDTLSIQQSLSYYRVSNPLFSPNNKKLVFVVNEPASIEKGSFSHIWLYTLSDKTIRQYSNSVKSEFNPKWKPQHRHPIWQPATHHTPTTTHLRDMAWRRLPGMHRTGTPPNVPLTNYPP